MKAGERREVVDRASQKGLPRIKFDKDLYITTSIYIVHIQIQA
jgi:hypothetical protein